VVLAISITLVGRYSYRSEWQVYKTLTISLIKDATVFLGVSLSTIPRAPSLRSLFPAWVCFSVAFCTVFQAFLTSLLIDSGYKSPIRNMDELFASGVKFGYTDNYNSIFERGGKTELQEVLTNHVNFPSFNVCVDWVKIQKHMSVLLFDNFAEYSYAGCDYVG